MCYCPAMICYLLKAVRSSSFRSGAALAVLATSTLFLGGCAGTGGMGGSYSSTAYAPRNPDDVHVKVSLHTQNVYVEEGNHLLMATATCVGKPGYPTPTGHYQVTSKDRDKRSSTYGYWVRGSEAHPGASANPPPGGGWHYIGYPLAFWVEFTPGYGFSRRTDLALPAFSTVACIFTKRRWPSFLSWCISARQSRWRIACRKIPSITSLARPIMRILILLLRR